MSKIFRKKAHLRRSPATASREISQTAITIDSSSQPRGDGSQEGEGSGHDEKDMPQNYFETKELDTQEYNPSREIPNSDDMRELKIHRLDLTITIILYYASLIINSLTLSSDSSPFLFNLLFRSFALNLWQFGQLDLIGRITGLILSLQSLVFLVAVGIYAFSRISRSSPKRRGRESRTSRDGNIKIYYGGPFQIVHLFKSFFGSGDLNDAYYDSLKNYDAQISQFMGILGYFLIIIAAIIAGSNEVTEVGTSNAISHSAYKATVAAVILFAILNIMICVADIWKIGSEEIILYVIIRNSCCGENRKSRNTVGILDRNILTTASVKSATQAAMTGLPTVVKTSTGITASPALSRSNSPSKVTSSRNSSPISSRPSSVTANVSASSLSRSLQPSTVSTASPSQSRSALATDPPATSSRMHYDLSPSRPITSYPTETTTYYGAPSAGIVERQELTQEVIYGGSAFEEQNLTYDVTGRQEHSYGNVGEPYVSRFEEQVSTPEGDEGNTERLGYAQDSEGFDRQELIYGGVVEERPSGSDVEEMPSGGGDIVERRESNTPPIESQRFLPQRTATIQRQAGLRRNASSNRARRNRRNESEESVERGRPR
ncbi:15809_t:CDS:2 [Acaulospora colombiana]|uniref:15809_t:CDS:1 n=1 Tax=Acaulospora colombiana TaxID=27376 RepID=A0ACA9LEN9_9GLOM|nr:15809_t:CDS:2 [Acaulospora colombiana]